MAIPQVKNPSSILKAVALCRKLGRDQFLTKFGYGRATDYVLVIDDEQFDSKAILGVSQRFEPGGLGSAMFDQFSGGKPVAKKLRSLGFHVENITGSPSTTQTQASAESLEADLRRAATVESEKREYDPKDDTDARRKVVQAINQRRGQPAFRKRLMAAYGDRCAITGCGVIGVLEAAHIQPYLGDHTNYVQNGLLLRADIHTLFDLNLIAIDEKTNRVILAPSLRKSHFKGLHDKLVRTTTHPSQRPNQNALLKQRQRCEKQWETER